MGSRLRRWARLSIHIWCGLGIEFGITQVWVRRRYDSSKPSRPACAEPWGCRGPAPGLGWAGLGWAGLCVYLVVCWCSCWCRRWLQSNRIKRILSSGSVVLCVFACVCLGPQNCRMSTLPTDVQVTPHRNKMMQNFFFSRLLAPLAMVVVLAAVPASSSSSSRSGRH